MTCFRHISGNLPKEKKHIFSAGCAVSGGPFFLFFFSEFFLIFQKRLCALKYQVSAGKSGNAAPVFFRRKETDPRVGMGQCGTGIALIISVEIISVKKISARNKCAGAEAERGPSIRHYRLQIITGNGKIPERGMAYCRPPVAG